MDEPRRFGPFDVIAAMADGGMGVVYQGRHRVTGAIAAIKTVKGIDARLLASIRHELHALALLEHPGVVKVLAEGVEDGVPWFAMEFVEGQTLGAFCADKLSWMSVLGRTSDTVLSEPPAEFENRVENFRRDVLDGLASFAFPVVGSDSSVGVAATLDAIPVWRADAEKDELPLSAELSAVLEVISRVAWTLAYLHGEGVVHRDLKPDNILVRSDGMPIIIDFGVSAAFGGMHGRELLHVTSSFVGTPDYTSPEQIRGEYVDARADLYALGCILYEACTGEPPFSYGGGTLQVCMHHLQTPPKPVSKVCKEPLPQRLVALIEHLLAKRPVDRVGHAEDVAVLLETLIGKTDPLPPVWLHSRPYLYRPRLVGRESILELVSSTDLKAGAGRHLMLTGPSGIGRTRVAMAIGRVIAMNEDHTVLTARCRGHSAPMGPWIEVLQSILDLRTSRGTAAIRHVFTQQSAHVLADFLPQLRNVPQLVPAAPLPSLSSKPGERRLFVALADVLERFGALGPTTIVMDDLDLADEVTCSAIAFLHRSGRLERLPMLLLTTHRNDIEPSPAFERVLSTTGPRLTILRPLEPLEIGETIRDMMALSQVPSMLRDFLASTCEGNPFFATELLQASVEAQRLVRNADRGWHFVSSAENKSDTPLGLPNSINALVLDRLDTLSPEARRMVQAAATLGYVFDEADLRLVLDIDEASALRGAVELGHRRLLEVLPGGRLAFINGRVRETVLRSIESSTLDALHWRCAEVLTLTHGEGTADATIGAHWLAAGDGLRAAEHFLRAARDSVQAYALGQARSLFEQYLSVAPITKESIHVRIEIVDHVLQPRGEAQAAIRLLTDTVGLARAEDMPVAEGSALRWLGVMYRYSGDRKTALETLNTAVAVLEACEEPKSLGDTLNSRANVLMDGGDYAPAASDARRALKIAKQLGIANTEAIVLGTLALLARRQGDLASARTLNENALSIHIAGENRYGEGLARTNLAGLCFLLGDGEQSETHYRLAIEALGDAAEARTQGLSTVFFGMMLCLRGDFAKADALAKRGLDLAARIGDGTVAMRALEVRTDVALAQGDATDAERHARAAIGQLQFVTDKTREPVARTHLGQALLMQDRLKEASAEFEHAIAVAEQSPHSLSLPLAYRSVVLVKRGRMAEAERAATEALAALLPTDDPARRIHIHVVVGEVFAALGLYAQATEAADTAYGLYQFLSAGRYTDRIERLHRQIRSSAESL